MNIKVIEITYYETSRNKVFFNLASTGCWVSSRWRYSRSTIFWSDKVYL